VGGWTPETTGDKLEAKTHLECSKHGKTGEMGNFGLQKGELPILHIIFSQEDGCPRVRENLWQ